MAWGKSESKGEIRFPVTLDLSDEKLVEALRGSKGDKGDSIQGPKGDPGKDSIVPGPKGDKGDSIRGDKGDKGDPGNDSTVPGPKGDVGPEPSDERLKKLIREVLARM